MKPINPITNAPTMPMNQDKDNHKGITDASQASNFKKVDLKASPFKHVVLHPDHHCTDALK